MPVSVNMKGSGEPISPSDIRALLTRPLLPPNRSAQPSVRATTEISSGPRITSRKKPFQRRAHAVEDVGLRRTEHGGDQRRQQCDAEGPPEHLGIIRIGRDLVPVLQDEDRLDAFVLAPVVEREHHRHGKRDHQHADEQHQRRRGERPCRARIARVRRRSRVRRCRVDGRAHAPPPAPRRLMSSGRQASRTASPSAGCGWPSFWRITIAEPHSLSH